MWGFQKMEKKLKVLNLYAGIGGNRKLWKDVDVTAIEINPSIAAIYQDFFPKDKVIVGDAVNYLLEHFEEFDFIWASPPCPSHSKIRLYSAVGRGQNKPILPDMTLWQTIIFLKHHFKGKWAVENVKTYYTPLIRPYEMGNHYYWSNFPIPKLNNSMDRKHNAKIEELSKRKGFDISKYKTDVDKKKILRNCVESEEALYVFNCAFKTRQEVLI